jgi:hypothetical protein
VDVEKKNLHRKKIRKNCVTIAEATTTNCRLYGELNIKVD